MMDPYIKSISKASSKVREDVFPLDQWTITTRKGVIMQSKCTCFRDDEPNRSTERESRNVDDLCKICKYHRLLPNLHNMPDMLFHDNLLRLEHFTGVGIEFNALEALKLVEETKDPLQVSVAGGWQSARADFPFARIISKPFDWTFTTNYRGTILSTIRGHDKKSKSSESTDLSVEKLSLKSDGDGTDKYRSCPDNIPQDSEPLPEHDEKLCFLVEETDERIDVNKLKVREEILFYDDVTLYEDELADHGTAQYSIKVRVMSKCLFILARFYLRVDGVLARINDTRIFHELNRNYLLREYTNREAKLGSLQLPVSTLVNPNELMHHLPIIESRYERLSLPKLNC